MSSSQKVSVSLHDEELRWVKATAKRSRLSVSSLVNEALRLLREERERKQAQQAFLAQYEPEERATDAEMEEIRKEWRQP
jgi:Arc/MetJ-type ribon-helix-helix transcriptional regulator